MRRFKKYPVLSSETPRSKWDSYDWYKFELKDLKKLSYDSKGHGSATVTETVDDDGYKRACVNVAGSYLSGSEARELAKALNAIADELDEFNANYDLKDEDF